ncbi:MAG: MFS transporter [Chloroflexi bacterium]|nr:MFS transporter [Chloroflexota bacterium]
MQQKAASASRSPAKRGFYYGWVIVVVTGLIQFAGGTETFPVLGLFLAPMTDELGWSRASFSAPMTIGTILGGFAGILVGPAIDKYGARWIMTVAAVVLGSTFFLMGFVTELWQHFVLQIIARGVTAGAFFLVVGIVLPKWFVAMRGRATAYSGVGGRLGHFLTPIMVQTVIALFGWRAAWASLGFLVWGVAIIPVFFFLKSKPEDMGLLPDGLTAEDAARLKAEEEEKQKAKGGRRSLRVVQEVSLGPKEALRTRAFYLMLLAQSLLSLVISGLHFHWFAYMTGQGLSNTVAVASISLASLVGIPVSFLAGFLAERVHVRYILLVTYLGFALSVLVLLNTTTPFMAYLYAISLGSFSGVTFTVSLVVWADYYGRGSLGAIRGMTSPINQMTNASGPLVAALAFDLTGGYTAILWTFLAIAGGTSLCWLLATPPKPKAAPVPAAAPVD